VSRGLAAAAVCLASVATSACGRPPDPPAHPDQDARVIREEHAPDKLVVRGRAFQQIGDLVRAEQYFAAALQAGADPAEVLPLLLRVCIEATRYMAAIEYAEPYLQRHPEDHRLRLVVASLYAAIGQPARARAHYERVLEEHADEPTAHWALGVLLRDQVGDRVGADAHFREYLRLRPEGPHAEEARSSLLKPVAVAPVVPVATVAPAVSVLPATSTSVNAPGPMPIKIEGKRP
jgi:tetratricopeptide (TPR) repeat protein